MTTRNWLIAGLLFALVGASGFLAYRGLTSADARSAAGSNPPVTDELVDVQDEEAFYEDYAHVLRIFVDDRGMVNYAGLKENRQRLDRFAERLNRLSPGEFEKWSDERKIAFWSNAYNALTLIAIIDNYPIQASFFRSLRFPSNSIRQIAGVWDRLTFPVMGRELTLDQIEHEILRAEFDEPRIHQVLVCAAMGCPPLRTEPYYGSRLEEQLDDQSVRFLNNPDHFRIDRESDRVHFSSIFSWFGEDYVSRYGSREGFEGHGEPERAVLNYASQYVDEEDALYLREGRYRISYLSYDWSLNEQ